MRTVFLAILFGAFLTGCATNMSAVSTFGKSTEALATQTTTVLGKYASRCDERLDSMDHQLAVATAVVEYWQGIANHPADQATQEFAKKKIEQVTGLRQAFAEAQSHLQANCKEQQEALKVLPLVGTVLSNYGSHLQKLAADGFVSYDAQVSTLTETLNKLKSGGKATFLTNDEVSAVEGVEKLLYETAVKSYRQRELHKVLNPDVKTSLTVITKLLTRVAEMYNQSVTELATVEYKQALAILKNYLVSGAAPDPLPIAQLREEINAKIQKETTEVPKAIADYIAAIDAFDKAFDAAEKSIDSPPAKDIAKEIYDFSKAAWQSEQAISKAF